MTSSRFALSIVITAFVSGISIASAQVPAPGSPPPSAPSQPPTPAGASQTPQAPTGTAVEPVPAPPPAARDEARSRERGIVRMGQDVIVEADETAEDVVVIMGNVTVRGHVDGDVVAIVGTVRLESAAVVEGDVVSIAGGITVAPGASAGRDMVSVGGPLDVPPTFERRGDQVVIDPTLLGMKLDAFVPYLTRGLLWGRLIVPDLGWVWAVVGGFFLLYLVINLFMAAPVHAVSAVLTDKMLTAFGTGLLVLLLLGPASLLLTISVVGILVIPVLVCVVLIAALVGKVGALRWVGTHLMRHETVLTPLQSMAALSLGFAVVSLIYMVPILGLVSWALLSVLGLGAATLALIAAYRVEQPPSLPAPVMPPDGGDNAPHMGVPPPLPAERTSTSAQGLPSGYDMLAFPRATFGDRLAALVLDAILVGLLVQMMGPLRSGRMFGLGLLVYHVGFWTWQQTTIGGIICHLRVARMDGNPMRFVDGLVRGLSSIFSVVVFGLGFFWILRDPERQAWHDKIAGTYVVKVPRNWALQTRS